jgi:histidinol-phosphate aminotransferase
MTARPEPRPEILGISPYVGGESKLPGVNRTIKLSSNEGPFGPSPGAVAAFKAAADELHRYPDGSAAELRAAIGARFGLDPARIVCGAGSDDLIYQLCLAYGGPGRELVMTEHGFAIYQIAGQYAGSHVVKVPERDRTADVDAILAAITPATTAVFIANPNNPTGTMIGEAEMARLRAGLPEEVLLVIDAAYTEYVERDDFDPGIALVDAGHNTVMTRTFSKMWGLGGMRVGWCYAPDNVVDVLNRVRGPFNVSVPAQAAAIAALAEPGWLERCRAHNTEWRAKLTAMLRATGLSVGDSEGNFVLPDFGSAEKAEAANEFLKSRGIIVRGVRGYGLPTCLRITVGTAEECTAVADTLKEFMRSHG